MTFNELKKKDKKLIIKNFVKKMKKKLCIN
jgi:hypothetical protein